MSQIRTLRRAVVTIVLAVGSLLLIQCSSSTEPEKPLTNRVYFARDVQVTAGDRFAVPIYFENNINLGAINIPLDYDTAFLRCDSVSFLGSRVGSFLIQTYGLHSTSPQILIGAIDSAAGAEPGSGLLANLHFWAYGFTPDTTLSIWTPENPHAGLNLGFRDTSLTGGPIVPEFEAGEISVKGQR